MTSATHTDALSTRTRPGTARGAIDRNARLQDLLDDLLSLHRLTQDGHLRIDALDSRQERLQAADIRFVLDGLSRVLPEHIGRLVAHLYSRGIEPTRPHTPSDGSTPAFDDGARTASTVLDSLCLHLRRTRIGANAALCATPPLDHASRGLIVRISNDIDTQHRIASADRHRQPYCRPRINGGRPAIAAKTNRGNR